MKDKLEDPRVRGTHVRPQNPSRQYMQDNQKKGYSPTQNLSTTFENDVDQNESEPEIKDISMQQEIETPVARQMGESENAG